MEDELLLLTLALQSVTTHLNNLIEDCYDEKGAVKAPSYQVLKQSQACLPKSCSKAFKK